MWKTENSGVVKLRIPLVINEDLRGRACSYQLVLDGKYADSRAWTYAESIANKDKIAWIPKLDAETFVAELRRSPHRNAAQNGVDS